MQDPRPFQSLSTEDAIARLKWASDVHTKIDPVLTLLRSFCANRPDHLKYVVSWLASVKQGIQTGIALVLQGDGPTGKSLFAKKLLESIRPSFESIDMDFFGRFSPPGLAENTNLLCIDGVGVHSLRDHRGDLDAMISEGKLTIAQPPSLLLASHLNVLLVTQQLPPGETLAGPYCVLDCDPAWQLRDTTPAAKRDFFQAVAAVDPTELTRFLREVDVSQWKPLNFPA